MPHNNVSVENNFIGGLKSDYTGLNFPENACTSTSNCVFSIIGNAASRPGINYEPNFTVQTVNSWASVAISNFKWNNAGGDGASEIEVVQIGGTLRFFVVSNVTASSGLSRQLITPTITLSTYLPSGSAANPALTECQYATGNGFLFVFHSALDPFYVTYDPAHTTIGSGKITLQQRDFTGISPEPGNPAVDQRPGTLTNEHNYNLQNQGWTNASTWSGTSPGSGTAPAPLTTGTTTMTLPNGSTNFTIQTGLTISNGTAVNISWSDAAVYQASGNGNYNAFPTGTATGTVTSYTSGTGALVINVTGSTVYDLGAGASGWVSFGTSQFTITSSNLINTISTWQTQIGNYPSNADIWFEYIVPQLISPAALTPAPGLFSPSNMISLVPLSATQSPQGHFLLNVFSQDRTGISGVPSITVQSTTVRPRTGAWFQGRVWYAGVDASFAASGDMPYYTWTENVYFSQVAQVTGDFGLCFQANDPTDDKSFDLLPTDGGVITIQGSGAIYKLFPIQNGLLVFARNGIWLIRGNSGLGFTANDYSVNKISGVQSIGASSIVDVLGLPFFWNHEDIYAVQPTQGNSPYGFGGFNVEPLCLKNIRQFYNNIPHDSKVYARGTYDPVNQIIKWIYKTGQETGIVNRYQFSGVLNLNLLTKAFYPYSVLQTGNAGGNNFIAGIQYVSYPTGSVTPMVKYLITAKISGSTTGMVFDEENDTTNWVDYFGFDSVGAAITSTFTTGFRIHGQAFKKWMPIYVTFYTNGKINQQFTAQGIWDYALGPNQSAKRITATQTIDNTPASPGNLVSGINWPLGNISAGDYATTANRIRIPGHGKTMQLLVTSIAGQPFDIQGWSIPEYVSMGS